MCHFLYVASPLTLSEVRSMLPRHLVADLLDPGPARLLLATLPDAQTALRLLVGNCSCDLFLERDPRHRHEESTLRRRYRALGLDRAQTIAALERHRQGTHPAVAPQVWQAQLAAFAAEHARNAGDTIFYHQFSAGDLRAPGARDPRLTLTAAAAAAAGEGWLAEDTLVTVTPA